MKKTLSTLLALVLFMAVGFSQNKKEKRDRQFPSFIQVSEKVAPSQSEVIFQKHFQLADEDELRQLDTRTDELGFTHQRYQQYYQGVPVEGGVVGVHAKNGNIQTVTGSYFNVFDLKVQASLSESQAFTAALNTINATTYIWDSEDEHEHEHEHGLPVGELVVVGQIKGWHEEPRLAYKFDIYALEPLMRANVFIDAHTGEFITAHHRIHHTDTPANGNSLYNGNVSFTADFTGSTYRLRQAGSGGGVETYTLNNGTNYNNASDITSGSSSFGNTNQTAVQAHYGAEETYDYFFTEHGRNSYNGAGAKLLSYVSYSTNYVNAFWDGSRMTYGDGDGVNYGPLVSLDITGHEIAHGVTEFSANLVYQRESGALNESFSDIFGEMVEFHATGANNWQMGTDIGIGGSGALRSMNNPNAFNDPDTYGGTYWTNPNCGTPTQSNDYCGVHSNSGVQNKWFYILVTGESGTNDIGSNYNVTGIGRTAAGAIAYRNLANYLSTNSTFADARAGTIQAAVDLYGAGSAEEIATTNAWYAVGVGGEYGTISYCNSNGNNVNDEYIQRVQLNTIDNTSGAGGGYSNHLDISTDLTQNSSYNITITPLWTGTVYAEGYSVWIDYNQDGDFTDAGEQVYTQAATTATSVSGSFTIPAGAPEGETRMRVSMKYNGIPTACESFTYGEVEDYTVNIVTGGAPDTQAPSVPTNLTASGTTQTSTNLSWTGSTDNVGVAGYNVYQDGVNIGSVAGTSTTVNGLTASTSYSFTVTAYDAAGNESAASNAANVTTNAAPDTQAPSVPTNLTASGTTQTSTNLSWTGSTDNVGVAGYNVYQDGLNIGSVAGTSTTVNGLTASTSYSFTVTAYDAAGNESAASNAANVTTDAAPDTQAPSVPTNLTASGTTQTSTNLSWTGSTDNVGVAGYNVYQDGVNIGSVAGTSTTVNGLTASTSYSFTVTAYDAAGNESAASNAANVTTDAAPDTQAPSVPTNLTASGTTQTSTNLSWTGSTDNVGVAGYNVYQDGVNIGSVAGTSTTVNGLTASTSYSFTVTAYDAAGNESAASNAANVTTDAAPDTQAPSVPTNLTASGTTQTSTNLSWTGSTDNVGVAGYNVYQDGVNIGSVAGTSTTVNGLTASTSYSFTVTAYDAAGNESAASNAANVTTDAAPDTQAPSVPTNLTASGTTQTSTNLSWTGSTDNVGVAGYNVYQDGVNIGSVAGTSTTVNGLTASTSYSFTVTAYDAAGNESAASNAANVTTEDNGSGCNDNEVVISINLDNYPEETSWQVTDAGGSVVASGGTYGSQPDGSNITETLCLVDGCYNFTIFDSYGDGICCSYGVGDYSVTSDGTTFASGAAFGSSETTNFCLGDPPAPTCDDGIQNGDETGVDCGGSSCPTCPPGGTDVLLGSYFESGWDGWSDGGSDCYRYSGNFSYEGNFSIRIRDNSGTASAMTSGTLNLSSYDAVEVEFYFYPNSMENGEDFWLRYYNGSSWQTVATYARGTSFNNGTFYTATVTLSSADYNLASNGRFRFQCDASANADQVYIDAVEIRGITGAGFLAGTIPSGASITKLDTPAGKELAGETIAVGDEELEDMLVYPNPAQDYLQVMMPEGEKIEQIRIFAANGTIVKQLPRLEAGQRLDITKLSAGIYFLQVETTEGVRQQKFVKL